MDLIMLQICLFLIGICLLSYLISKNPTACIMTGMILMITGGFIMTTGIEINEGKLIDTITNSLNHTDCIHVGNSGKCLEDGIQNITAIETGIELPIHIHHENPVIALLVILTGIFFVFYGGSELLTENRD